MEPVSYPKAILLVVLGAVALMIVLVPLAAGLAAISAGFQIGGWGGGALMLRGSFFLIFGIFVLAKMTRLRGRHS